MNEFVKHLPDAAKSFNSTIEDVIVLDDKTIKLMAQKIKGEKGMCWNIHYKTTGEQNRLSDRVYEAYM